MPALDDRVLGFLVTQSAPVAAVSAIAMAIEVSSVHSPGSKGPSPPPIMSTGTSGPSGGPNS